MWVGIDIFFGLVGIYAGYVLYVGRKINKDILKKGIVDHLELIIERYLDIYSSRNVSKDNTQPLQNRLNEAGLLIDSAEENIYKYSLLPSSKRKDKNFIKECSLWLCLFTEFCFACEEEYLDGFKNTTRPLVKRMVELKIISTPVFSGLTCSFRMIKESFLIWQKKCGYKKTNCLYKFSNGQPSKLFKS